jgi:hypothetical protein
MRGVVFSFLSPLSSLLTFQQEIIRDIAPDSVLEIITPSLCFEADDDYILDEDVCSRLAAIM